MHTLITITRTRVPAEPALEALQLVAVLQALSDPVRLGIVRTLAKASGTPCKDCACPSIPKSTLAHHFKVLRQAGVIRSREVGTQVHNELREFDLEQRFPGLLAVILQSMTKA
jgi:DNA-binding transcriptional ArsR family regulator